FRVVIIDYQMPGISGAETTLRILRYDPQIKILALSNYDELPYIQSMMDSGASGYVLKNIEPAQLFTAIKTILGNNYYYSNEVAIKLIEGPKKDPPKDLRSLDLTKREIEILKMISL